MLPGRLHHWKLGLLALLVVLCSLTIQNIPWASHWSQTNLIVTDGVATAQTVEQEMGNLFTEAVKQAEAAASLAQTARTPEEWDQVTRQWTEAFALMQSVPADSPQRVFAQRKAREYSQNIQLARQRAEAVSFLRIYPSLGSPVLDEQVVVFQSYLATVGVPDVLIVGSSRALQGIDPQQLQSALAAAGWSGVRVYNFGINGATGQVVNLLLQGLLTPDQLPKLLIWADGSRAFNSGRPDLTYNGIVVSPGYRLLQQGVYPSLEKPVDGILATPLPVSDINAYGFRPIADRFSPDLYYQQFPRVEGIYDGTYNPFYLEGVQTEALQAAAAFALEQSIPLVFVNLPLSQDYLDGTRLQYEQQFQQFLQTQGWENGFTVVDLLTQWLGQNALFADPSHVNREGASAIARQLATQPQIPWQVLQPVEEPGKDPTVEETS